jgi:SAM-dependent methyltransferase
MSNPVDPDKKYDSLFSQSDTPLMRQVCKEAYGEDIGQHSWVVAEELRKDIARLRLSSAATLVDLGCGPCGPLVFVVDAIRCRAAGVELSAPALDAGRARAASHGVEHLLELRQLDLNEPLPFADASFAAAMSLDVILHIADRAALFREVARILAPGGRLLFTDAAVITGSMSSEQVRLRSIHGLTHFAGVGFNERCLEATGFRLLETEDRTASVLRNAAGRLAARLAHKADLERLEGSEDFVRQQEYLETVIGLAESRTLARIMYLAQI